MRRQVIECDRCGVEIRNPAGATRITSDRPVMVGIYPTKSFDLCDPCGDSFEAFIKNQPVRCAGKLTCNM